MVVIGTVILLSLLASCHCAGVSECRRPKGDTCQWYITCLNRYAAKPATFNTDGNYALGYGFKYCKRFGDNLNKFSPAGRMWINKTRKCLQVALAPYVGTNMTNWEIKGIAFKSHTGCYVLNGLCRLPPSDWLVIVNTIRDAFLSEFLQTGRNIITSSLQCLRLLDTRFLEGLWDTVMVEKQKLFLRLNIPFTWDTPVVG